MNKFLLLAILSLSLFSFTVLQVGKDEIVSALKQGNADQLVKYFDSNVDITLPNSDDMKGVPKAQAAATVKSFFADNNISSCTVTSQRENAGTMYVTGKLMGANNYNITVMSKGSGDRFSIITLRVNK